MSLDLERTPYISTKRNIVVDPLVDFKSMFIHDLFEEQKEIYGKNKQSFYKLINRMENDGLLQSVSGLENNRKIIFLTQKGAEALDRDYISFANREALRHDALVSAFVLNISKNTICYNYEIPYSQFDDDLIPDAKCLLDIGGDKKQFYIEVELTRKSRERQLTKMRNYINHSERPFVIYYFDKRGVFNSYKESMKNMLIDLDIEEKNNRIILCHSPDMLSIDSPLMESEIYIQGQKAMLKDIFHE